MSRRIFFLLLTLSLSFASQAALVFGPEQPISQIEYGPPLDAQQPSDIASDGNGFLAVWSDAGLERRGIYAAPISAAGEIRPESQILIRRDETGTGLGSAKVAWSGESYLVFWNEPVAFIRMPMMADVVPTAVEI